MKKGRWPLHSELASEHLQEKFRKVLKAQKAKGKSCIG
jgi:hypothetical protein